MKKTIFYFTLIFLPLLSLNSTQAQNNEKSPSPTPKDSALSFVPQLSINPDKWYIDASGGYYPKSDNSSWAAQLGLGYRIKPTIALGIGATYWGRVSLYQRSAWGIGVQYRQLLGDYFIAKAEVGYVVKAALANDFLDSRITYEAKSSTPIYYKLDLNWRIRHFLTLGVSFHQTRSLKFLSSFPDTSTVLDTWRINAFTVQLGIALDTPESE
jgi:hypothetical protein